MKRLKVREQPRTRIDPDWPMTRKIKVWMYMTLSPYLIYAVLLPLTSSLRWRASVHPETAALIKSGKPFALPFWHGDLVLVDSIARHINLNYRTVIMVGLSQVGEIGARFLEMLGYSVIRGSRKNRSRQAMTDLMDAFSQGGIAGFAVDGPSGPAGIVKPGVVLCAREAGVPVIPISFRADNPWRLKTWDKTVFPRPFAKCIAILGAPMYEYSDRYINPYLTARDVAHAMEALGKIPLQWEECAYDATYFRCHTDTS